MTTYYVYRGVRYTKDENQNVIVQHDSLREKFYRGVAYLKAPLEKHMAGDHVYRGAHYMA